ncbi:MAG: glycosyltransferase [Caldiserica bacterium]|jgi:rhamnosyl/mannosyltransferase|nr:glycosyltransferase [Caldisericota bacterium]
MDKKPRVLQVNKLYFPHIGGVEKVVQRLGEGLAQEGYSITVLACGPKTEEKELNGVHLQLVKTSFYVSSAPFSFSFPSFYKKLSREADLIIHHFPDPAGELAELIVNANPPKIVLYHSDVVRQKALKPFYDLETRIFLSRAKYIVATSPNYAQTSPILSQFKEKVRIIPLAVDTDFFTPEGPVHPILSQIRQEGFSIVLYVGRFAYYKGLEYLIKAVPSLPQNVRVVLVGDGEGKPKLLSLVKELHLEERVVFIPPVKDEELPSVYRGADVFVLPSIARSEAFGLVACEAMACGVPVITTEIGTGTSFYNLHGQTGLIISPKDAMELSKAIMDLFRQGREEFSSFARERIVNDFSQDVFLSRWEDVIESL